MLTFVLPLVLLPQTRIATRAYKLLATLTKAYLIPKKAPNQGAAEAAATAGRSVGRQLLTIQHDAPGSALIAQKRTCFESFQNKNLPNVIFADNRRTLSPEFEALVGYVHKDLTPCLNHALKDLGSVSGQLSAVLHVCPNTAGLSRQSPLLQAWRQAIESRHALWP